MELESNYQFLFRAIAHRLKLIGDEKLEKYELTNYQARMLKHIAIHEDTNLHQVDLEKIANIRGSSVTNMLKTLEKREFIVRKIDPTDERKKIICTLPKAKELIEDFNDMFANIEKDIAANMNDKEKEQLSNLLNKVLENLR